jgi:geranylgeranyl pyrophosphate synthase
MKMMASFPRVQSSELTQRLVRALRANLVASPGVEANLGTVVTEALENPGRLFRAMLVWRVLTSLGSEPELADSLACSVEYFHLASLLLDDLPCMDDATVRRGRPCPHLKHGDATVILASLALINRAYFLIWQSLAPLPIERRLAANECLERQLGLTGIVNGQALDLRFGEQSSSPRQTSKIALGKTVALFRLALEFPALVGGAANPVLLLLRRLCVYWGLFYQASDDLSDFAQGIEIRESTGRDVLLAHPNLLVTLGREAFDRRMNRLARLARQTVDQLNRLDAAWHFLSSAHENLVAVFEASARPPLLSRAS